MNENQIKWREQIKADINLPGVFTGQKINSTAAKAINYINNIENLDFWIVYKNNTASELLWFLLQGTLRIKGLDYPDTAYLTQDGTITES